VRNVDELAGEAMLDPAIRVSRCASAVPVTPEHLFLTGATGFLGVFLLRELLATTGATIHCLVRGSDLSASQARLNQALARYFPGEPLDMARIVAVPGDLAQPQLGLPDTVFERLAEQMDMVVHSGAQVNWLAPYARLRHANVSGTATIIRLAAYSRPVPLHFVSSLAVFPITGYEAGCTIDECTPLDHGGVLHGGYTQSKWVAEKLAAEARARGLPVAIYRPSLVVGDSRTGSWQGENIVASMLRSWIELGMAPAIDAQFDLVPVDYVSHAMVQLMIGGDARGGIYHLNNLRTAGVSELVDWLNACGYAVRPVPYSTWRSEMLRRGDVRRQAILDAVGPLLALQVSEDVGWLGHMPRFSSQATAAALGSLSCPPVDAAILQSYVKYLKGTGFLPV
jgi:thioester reductase-like protein